MSLFIGNISRDTTEKDIEDLFSKYGKCKINFKGTFAFAAYEEEKIAEKAKEELNSKKLNGREINIEWCKSKPREPRDREERERYSRGRGHRDGERENIRDSKDMKGKCFICNKYGHFARDCPESDSRRKYIDKRKNRGFYNRYRRSRSKSKSKSRNYYASHRRRTWREDEKNNKSRSSSRNNYKYNDRRRKNSGSCGDRNSFGSKSRSWSRSRSRNRSRSRSKSRNEDRNRDRNGERYKNIDDRGREREREGSNSREKYYDKKEKSNGANNACTDEAW